MKDNFFFEAQARGEKKQNKIPEIVPLSAEFHKHADEAEEKPMDHRDYLSSMRADIQEKTNPNDGEISPDQLKKIQELISPELMLDYKKILLDFKKKAVKNDEHPNREYIDAFDEEVQKQIQIWTFQLKKEITSKNTELSENDFEDLENLSQMFFQSMACVFNTRSIELDIKESLKEKQYDSADYSIQDDILNEVSDSIEKKYELTKTESKMIVELQINKERQYSPKVLFETLGEIFKEYELGDKKMAMGKISAGFLVSRLSSSWAPERISNLSFTNLEMSASLLMQYYFMNKLGELMKARTQLEFNNYLNDLSKEINERITNSLFFQEFEFMHEKQSGELFTSLENGKAAILNLMGDFVSNFAPTGFAIASSLVFLSKINPILGVAGLVSLPITYKIAKKEQKKMSALYKDARERQSKLYSRMNSIKTGFEEVRISPDMASIATETKDMMNMRDDVSLERKNKELNTAQMFQIPYDVSVIGTTILSIMLQQSGQIPPGAVISSLMYNRMLQDPMNNMVSDYFNKYAYNVEDIKKMNKVFGAYEKFDIPEGQREKSRASVLDLPNLDIVLKDASFKKIFNNLNMEFKQGEFVTIGGSSGAGKTTLLRNIAGLYKPDKGSVEIGGTNIKDIKRYGNESLYSVMTYCNQSPIIFENMTLRENLTIWTKREVSDEKISQTLKRLHLEKFNDKLNERVSFLSGGERVRLGVARMLLKDPKIILLDEPTASLDSRGSTEVRNIIQELHQSNPEITIICVSHDDELLALGDRKINLEQKI